MNWVQYKDPVSHMCLVGTIIASWSLAQDVAGSSPPWVNVFHYHTIFGKKLLNNRLAHPSLGLPHPGKSWIRHSLPPSCYPVKVGQVGRTVEMSKNISLSPGQTISDFNRKFLDGLT